MVTWNIQMGLVSLMLSIILVWYVHFLWSRRKLYIYSWKVPGPFALPIIGSSYLFFGSPNTIVDTILKTESKYPGLAKIWLGPLLVYAVHVPEHIEKILMSPKCVGKGYLYKFVTQFIGTGLLSAPAEKWKRHRKMIMPSMHQKMLENFVEIFAEQSVIFMEQLMKQVGKKNIDLFLLINRYTLDATCETTMGVRMNNQTGNNDFLDHLDKGMKITTERLYHVWLHPDFMWKLSPLSKELEKSFTPCRNFISTIIKKKTEEYERKKAAEKSSPIAEIEEGTKMGSNFLDLMLETANFTEEELRDEICVFLTGGSDTTATVLCSLFVILGIYQDVQQKVYEEVVELLGEDRMANPSDLPNLKYTERVIKETLRLFPPVPFLLRTIGEDVDLGEAVLPTGSSATFSLMFIHRNPKYWPDPLKFDPDRFLPEEISKRHPSTYIPFSVGPRNCIGGRYAMMNIKTILSTFIRRLKIFTEYKSIEEIQFDASVFLRMKDGPKVSVDLR